MIKSTEPQPELIFLDIDVPFIRDLLQLEKQQGNFMNFEQAVAYTRAELCCSEQRAKVIVETIGIKP